jgi:choline dehydrogenase-like flavoprotein
MPVHIMRPPAGASIHYAGTLPFGNDDVPLTCKATGRLRGSANVYVADSSTWRFLPAKGLTFTLMANARRVAAEVASTLHS